MKTYAPVAAGGHPTFTNTRPVFVIDSLPSLHGPSTGVASLPLRLDWSSAATYDLSKPARVRTMYATVLREAMSEDDLAGLLNETLLREHWADLNLPRFIREAWEAKHPEMRQWR